MNTRLRHILTLATTAMVMAVLPSLAARADSVRLRGEATVSGDVVRLGDVAVLNGADIEAHAMLAVLPWPQGRERTAITLDAVREALADAKVNLARVTFSGRLSCDVSRQAAQGVPSAETPGGEQPDVNPVSALPVVRDLLVDLLSSMAGVTDRDELRFSFTDPGGMLDRPTGEGRYEFEPLATVIPGRVPVVVRRYAGEALAERARVHVDVERRFQAVVAQRRIPRGQLVRGEDVAIQGVFVRGGAEPVGTLDAVLGQVATGTLQAGDALAAGDVQAPRLVRRGDDMTVRCIVGNLVIRLTATAMEDGGCDQVIRVRNTSSRETFLARVIGAHEAVLVREAEDADSREAWADAQRRVEATQ